MQLKLNEIDIADIQERLSKTTEGPWTASGARTKVLGSEDIDGGRKVIFEAFPIVAGEMSIALVYFSPLPTETPLCLGDKEFIARSREWVPALLEDRMTMQNEIIRLKKELSDAGWRETYVRDMHDLREHD